MYYKYYKNIDSDTRDFPSLKAREVPGSKGTFYRSKRPIEWTYNKGYSIYLKVKDIPYPRRNCLPHISEEIDFELHKFLIALDAYQESNSKLEDCSLILKNCLLIGPTYAEDLKETKRVRFLNHINAIRFSDNHEYTENIPMIDIGDTFHYSHLIHWRIPEDEVNDIDWMNVPVDINPEILETFRETLTGLLEDIDITPISKIESILKLKSSKAYDRKSKTTKNHWLLSESNTTMSESIGEVKRSIIQVGPANARDAVILSVESLRRVNLIDLQTSDLVNNFDTSYQIKDEAEKKNRLRRLFYHGSNYYMRDIKKEGLTKPRELLTVMLEVLNQRYPEAEAYRCPEFFNDLRILNGDILFHPKRGHGLGMANSLTTLMQIVIDLMIKNEMGVDDSQIRTLVLNDDHIISAINDEYLNDYEYQDDYILKGLGLIQNKEKSVFSVDGFFFCEEYFSHLRSTINKKQSYYRRNSLLPLLCYNIVEAKFFTASLCTEENLPYLESYKEEIISKFGYEFFPEEINYPLTFGGWFTRRILGISMDLKSLEDLEVNNVVLQAYEACKENTFKMNLRISRRSYVNPVLIYAPMIDKQSEVFSVLGGDDYRKLYTIFAKPSSHPMAEIKAWDELKRKRRVIFQKKDSHVPSKQEFFTKVFLENPDRTFFPPRQLISRRVRVIETEDLIENLYYSPNAITSALLCQKIDLGADIDEEYSLSFESEVFPRKLKTDLKIIYRRLQLHSPDIILSGEFYPTQYKFLNIEDEIDAKELWDDITAIAKISFHCDGTFEIPLMDINPYEKLIEKKRRVFGQILLDSEILLYSELFNRDRKSIRRYHLLKDYFLEEVFREDIEKFGDFIRTFDSAYEDLKKEIPFYDIPNKGELKQAILDYWTPDPAYSLNLADLLNILQAYSDPERSQITEIGIINMINCLEKPIQFNIFEVKVFKKNILDNFKNLIHDLGYGPPAIEQFEEPLIDWMSYEDNPINLMRSSQMARSLQVYTRTKVWQPAIIGSFKLSRDLWTYL